MLACAVSLHRRPGRRREGGMGNQWSKHGGVNPQFSLLFMMHTNGQWSTLTYKREEGAGAEGEGEGDGKGKAPSGGAG